MPVTWKSLLKDDYCIWGELAMQKLLVEVIQGVVKCTQKDPEKLVDLSLNKAR